MTFSKICYKIAQLSLVFLIVIIIHGRPLPDAGNIVEAVKVIEPDQTPLYGDDLKPFSATFNKTKYLFTPHASYEIVGLVVSLHHSDSWIDISHADDPAQTVDLCLVWGKNITTNGYQMVEYDHGDWTCYYRWTSREPPPFEGSLLSNNHLIPTTPAIAHLLKSVHVGDQVRLTGKLVDYDNFDELGHQVGTRHTSLVRTDVGNGACEIVYVTGAEILRAHLPWRETVIAILIGLFGTGLFLGFLISMPKRDPEFVPPEMEHVPDPRDPTDPMNYVK